MTAPPPVPKYKLTLTITGNTLDEIEDELLAQIWQAYALAVYVADVEALLDMAGGEGR